MSNSTTATTATASNGTGDLESLRQVIEWQDQEIIDRILARRRYSQMVAELKGELGLPYTDISQERVVIARYTEQLGPYGASLAQDILRLSKSGAS